eukprot:symbB.v1.2.000743.t1/scaffold36.1/size400579/15
MRVARALRGIRVMRLLRFVHALRTLVLSIMSSIASLLWTAVLFLLLFYSFGVIFTQLVTDWCRDEAIADRNNINAIPACPHDLRWFETVPQSMLTLFRIISDGLDWDTVFNPLQQVSPMAAAFLIFYVIITVFAVVNVVNGVFVNTAVETAMHDKDVASMKQLQLQESIVQTLKQVFEEIDSNGTCLVSLEDIEVAMETRKLGGFLESMGISTQDMITLFMILDADKSGLLDLDEFVTGCMQLHGPAKSLQVAKMSHENKVTRQQLWQLRTAVVQMDIKLDKVLSECLVALSIFYLCLACLMACWGILSLLFHQALANELCFQEAISPSERKNVTLDGVSMPLGIAVGNWDSAILVNEIYSILVSEVLGFNIIKSLTRTSRAQVFVLAGCNGDEEAVPGVVCPKPRRLHVALENWYFNTEGPTAALSFWLSTLRDVAPVSGGVMNYVGTDGTYILGGSHQRGLEAGLALEYFRSYNKSWFNLEQYFPLVSQVDRNRLEFCNQTFSNNPEALIAYIASTNTTEGLEMVFDPATNTTKLEFKCYDEKWWVAPSCQNTPDRCLAVITRQGWGLMHLSQRAYFWNMPIAIASGLLEQPKNKESKALEQVNNEYIRLGRELQGLVYWWSPDTSFALERPSQIRFPPHSPSEYSQLLFKTMTEPRPLAKLVASGLENDATYLVRKFTLTDEELLQLLVDFAAKRNEGNLSDAADAVWFSACRWLHQNEQTWKSWLPNATRCNRGNGLVDEVGQYLESHSPLGDAVGCEPCPPGRSSVPWAGSAICQPCPRGFFQDQRGAVICFPCQKGFFTAEEGKPNCTACPLGYYADSTGTSRCSPCGTDEEQADLFTTSRLVDTEDGPFRIRIQGARSQEPLGRTPPQLLGQMTRPFDWLLVEQGAKSYYL